MRRGTAAITGIVAVSLLLAGCTGTADDRPSPSPSRTPATSATPTETESAPAPAPVTEPQVVASDLSAPWSIAFHHDTPLISERDSGRILALAPDGAAIEVAAIAGVDGATEGGLLGIAVHEDHLYAYFTAGDENRIERYPIATGPDRPTLGPAETVLTGIPAARTHNGGRIAFGPDGMLYATTGDAGVPGRAQDLASLGGKILRLAPDGTVPADNPFPGSPVYSYGHRNPQGLAWAADGTLYASEFGQDTWDELNIIRPGGNYGWPEAEGLAGDARFVDPVQEWPPAAASPSGIAILGESIYVANLRGERLRQIPLSDPGASVERYAGEYGRLRDVIVTPDGALWVLTNNTDGRGSPRPGDDVVLRIPVD